MCEEEPPAPPEPECETREYRSCVPRECTSDNDCATGMVCHAEDVGVCSSPAQPPCADAGECPKPEPASCTSMIVQRCTPRYALPCAQAMDCGAGFSCEAQEQCSCSGGSAGDAPTPSADAGQSDPGSPDPNEPSERDAGSPEPSEPPRDGGSPVPPSCACEPSDVKSCRPQQITCQANTDCPASWTCQTLTTRSDDAACAAPAAQDAGTPASQDGGAPKAEGTPDAGSSRPDMGVCDSAPPERVEMRLCVPPYAEFAGGIGRDESTSAPVAGGDTGEVAADAGTAPPSDPNANGADSDAAASKACSVMTLGSTHAAGGETAGVIWLLLTTWVVRRARRRS